MWIDLILIHLNSHMQIKTNLRISQTKYIFNVIKVSFVLITLSTNRILTHPLLKTNEPK